MTSQLYRQVTVTIAQMRMRLGTPETAHSKKGSNNRKFSGSSTAHDDKPRSSLQTAKILSCT